MQGKENHFFTISIINPGQIKYINNFGFSEIQLWENNLAAVQVSTFKLTTPLISPAPEPMLDWENVLTDIYKFALTNPTTKQQIINFLFTKNYPDPLAGVDLTGCQRSELLNKSRGTGSNQLSSGKGEFADYQNWTSLHASSDGNCFLNSFSTYLIGNESLAIRLRVKLCLWLMQNLAYVEIIGIKDSSGRVIGQKDQVASLIDKLAINENGGINWPLAENGQWIMTDDAKYFSFILSRPLRVLYRPLAEHFDTKKDYADFVTRTGGWASLNYNDTDTDYTHSEIWTICHVSGNHFEPLIAPTPELIEAKTPLNEAFRVLNQGIEGILQGDTDQSDYLESGDFAAELAKLDLTTYQAEINKKLNLTLQKLGINNEAEANLAQPAIKNAFDHLKRILAAYAG